MRLMRAKVKGLPKFNSNDVYMILSKQHKHSVLGDKPYTFFKAYLWIGYCSFNH